MRCRWFIHGSPSERLKVETKCANHGQAKSWLRYMISQTGGLSQNHPHLNFGAIYVYSHSFWVQIKTCWKVQRRDCPIRLLDWLMNKWDSLTTKHYGRWHISESFFYCIALPWSSYCYPSFWLHPFCKGCLIQVDDGTCPGCQTAKPWTKHFYSHIPINQVNRLEELLEATADCEDGEKKLVWALRCACYGGGEVWMGNILRCDILMVIL